jgi:hypothetical protein
LQATDLEYRWRSASYGDDDVELVVDVDVQALVHVTHVHIPVVARASRRQDDVVEQLWR